MMRAKALDTSTSASDIVLADAATDSGDSDRSSPSDTPSPKRVHLGAEGDMIQTSRLLALPAPAVRATDEAEGGADPANPTQNAG